MSEWGKYEYLYNTKSLLLLLLLLFKLYLISSHNCCNMKITFSLETTGRY